MDNYDNQTAMAGQEHSAATQSAAPGVHKKTPRKLMTAKRREQLYLEFCLTFTDAPIAAYVAYGTRLKYEIGHPWVEAAAAHYMPHLDLKVARLRITDILLYEWRRHAQRPNEAQSH